MKIVYCLYVYCILYSVRGCDGGWEGDWLWGVGWVIGCGVWVDKWILLLMIFFI